MCFCLFLGHCQANDKYIDQLKEVFDTTVPPRIAAFFGEPIQVCHYCISYTWFTYLKLNSVNVSGLKTPADIEQIRAVIERTGMFYPVATAGTT